MSPLYKLSSVFIIICLIPITLPGQGVSFTRHTFSGQAFSSHADLNSDGREDFVFPDSVNGGFFVQLSTGDGVYASPVHYALPGGFQVNAIGIGDFNSDGKADLVLFASDNNIHEFLNNGNGTFHQQASFAIGSEVNGAAVGDFNHDGRMDLAFLIQTTLHIWFGNGNGGFIVGPSTLTTNAADLMLGDFDGDGKADVAIGDLTNYDTVQVLYGDGTGHFPKTSFIRRTQGDHSLFAAADVNGDGKMDIVASTFYPANLKHISVYYGNASRSWSETQVPISHCASNTATPVAADVNGDGIADLVVPESDCGNAGTTTHYIGVLIRNSSGIYSPEQIVYTSSSPSLILMDLTVLRADRNTEPDLAFSQCTATPCSMISNYDLQVLLNTTLGNFPTCAPPNAFEGIHVCAPAPGSTVSSPVQFHVGAAGQTSMRKVEVWVDGHKVAEQLDGFSGYTFMDKRVTLVTGSHQVTIFAAGWDNWLEKTSYTLNVH